VIGCAKEAAEAIGVYNVCAIAPFLPQNVQMTFERWGSLPLFVLFALMWVAPATSSWFWVTSFRLAGAIGIPLALAGLGLKQFRIFG
jgi:hypothetical protein